MRKYLYILIMCTLPFTVMAQSTNSQKVVQQISQAAQSMKTMQCDFVQTKHLKMLNDKMVSKGKMYYQQADKLHWEYTTPYTYTFILNGSKVLLKKGTRNDVINVSQNKMFKEIARIMMNSVVGKCLTDTKSFKTSISESQSEYVATLIPQTKDMKQMWTKLVLHFNRKQMMVSKVEMHEKNGDRTIIELLNAQTNKTIDTKQFAIH